MSGQNTELKEHIKSNLRSFAADKLKENALKLFETLGYKSDRKVDLTPNNVEGFKNFLSKHSKNFHNEKKAHLEEWETVDFLFQLTDDEINKTKNSFDSSTSSAVDTSEVCIESYLFFAIKLKKSEYSRSKLAEITRELNRIFPMPVMIIFQHGDKLTFSIIDRRLHKRDASKDVLEKATLIKDIRIEKPHRAHIDILADLALQNHTVKNFVELHEAWKKTLDTKELNKQFFKKLANWYFWAVDKVVFPDGDGSETEEVRNATGVIRLITRVMFVWFLKEKGLVSDKLFDEVHLRKILKSFKVQGKSAFYKAVLQNLFFATLNSEMGKRKFIAKSFQGKNNQHFVHNVFRYKKEFINPDETIKELFEPSPFLNGGLFECLDKEVETTDGKKERIRVDGFSDHPKNVLEVPDELFFGDEREINLDNVFGTKNKKYKVEGLIRLLNNYKFTVAENTPIEEEIALDPELLGKVFENLLASYNPETQTTARKQTGSFYTPREIVNYMVDESLIAYLKSKFETEAETCWNGKVEELETALRRLFSYTDEKHSFNEVETKILVKAISECKIFDPACGSGAFPMGVLLKLVHVLQKLDPDNEEWRELQFEKAVAKTEVVSEEIEDEKERHKLHKEIYEVFEKNSENYGRKLYLIENCIYGVDVQAIAIQISKLRFFISLIVDQQINKGMKNLGIRPLPNLETKFVAANTLIGLDTNVVLKPTEATDLETELKEVRAKHFDARTRKTKEKYRQEDKRIRTRIAELLKQAGFPSTSADQISDWNPYDQNTSAEWFDAEYVFGIEKGFDIVIGNPPYVQIKQIPQSDRPYYVHHFTFATGRFNIFYLFLEISDKLTCLNGITTYIVPDRLLLNTQCAKLRYWLLKEKQVVEIDSFDESVFDSAVVDNIILSFSNKIPSQETIRSKPNVNISFIDRINPILIPLDHFLTSPNKQFDLAFNEEKSNIIRKIRNKSIFLKDISETKDGIIQGKVGDLLFLKSYVDSDSKPLLFGKDIDRYSLRFNNNWANYKPDCLRKVEIQRCGVGVGHGLRLRNPDIFEREKILTRQTADKIIGAIDNSNYYYANTLHGTAITDPRFDIKFILAVLNSKLINYYYKATTSESGKVFAQVKIGILRQLPIKFTTNQTVFTKIVEQIIESKKEDPNADTSGLEGEIDELVYHLYGLNDEEIAIVEGKD